MTTMEQEYSDPSHWPPEADAYCVVLIDELERLEEEREVMRAWAQERERLALERVPVGSVWGHMTANPN